MNKYSGRNTTQRIAPTVFSWLNHNENFLIHGHTLRQWIEDFKWSYKPLGKILGLKFEYNFFLQMAFAFPSFILRCAVEWTMIRDIDATLAMDYQLLTRVGGYRVGICKVPTRGSCLLGSWSQYTSGFAENKRA